MKHLIALVLLLAFVGCKQKANQKENNNITDIVGEVNAEKEYFAKLEADALKEPYVGIFTEKRDSTELFQIRSTGVSTLPIQKAAENFLNGLSPIQLQSTSFEINDEEWRKWCNVDNGIYDRQGVSLKELTTIQKEKRFQINSGVIECQGTST